MNNKSKRILGIIFLLVLIIIGVALRAKQADGGLGWTLVVLGILGLCGFLVDWIHNKFKKPGKTSNK
jgi:hypothetical protein